MQEGIGTRGLRLQQEFVRLLELDWQEFILC